MYGSEKVNYLWRSSVLAISTCATWKSKEICLYQLSEETSLSVVKSLQHLVMT